MSTRAERRARLRAEAWSQSDIAVLERGFPYFKRLSEADQRELLGHVKVFLAEKHFEGAGGLEVTEEMKLLIAAQACLLLLHRETDYYPGLESIVVYPHAYRAQRRERIGPGAVLERDQARAGESHQRGLVVLSWDAVEKGAENDSDGQNVVFHEFAHQLDSEDGALDGAPVLENRKSYGPWAKVLGLEYDKLVAGELDDGVISDYGATNPSEFFAVATEAFFERPTELAARHARLYEQLMGFYKQDPLERFGGRFVPPPSIEEDTAVDLALSSKDTTLCIVPEEHGARVGVSRAWRDAVLEIGCRPAGHLGTLHHGRGAREWGFIAEVLRCPDDTTVAALFHIGSFGDGLAFHTVLENGTRIETDTSKNVPRATRLSWWLPRQSPRDHSFSVWRDLGPRELYEEHRRRTRRIAEREGSSPVAADPVLLYIASRLRSVALLDQYVANRLRLQPLVAIVITVLVAVPVARLADKIDRGVIGVAIAAGFIVAALLSARVAMFIERRRFRSAPVPAKAMLARATTIDGSATSRLVRSIRGASTS